MYFHLWYTHRSSAPKLKQLELIEAKELRYYVDFRFHTTKVQYSELRSKYLFYYFCTFLMYTAWVLKGFFFFAKFFVHA